MNNTTQAIILAAGKSTRFYTEKTKLAYTICGQPMILFLTKLLEQLAINTTVVVGYQAEIIKKIITTEHKDSVTFVTQEQQNGTGHALACTQHIWEKDNILVLNGDVPLITSDIILSLYESHKKNNAAISFVTSCTTNETAQAYGRIVKKDEKIMIVEAKDFIGDPKDSCCINAGIYLINKKFLDNYIDELNTNNAQNEFYITDLVKIASDNSMPISIVKAPFNTIRGINTLHELSEVEQIKRNQIIRYWMDRGVHFVFPNSVHLDISVVIGAGSSIGSNVQIKGNSTIGMNCIINDYSTLNDVIMDNNSTIGHHCLISNTHIEEHSIVNAFANLQTTSVNSAQKIKGPLDSNNNTQELKFSFIGARIIHPLNVIDEQ